jgi:hypothetical protein
MRLIALWRQSLFSQINVSLSVPIRQRIVKVDRSKPMQRSQIIAGNRRLNPAGSIVPGFSRATVMHFPILRCARHLRKKNNNTL